ncbi:HAD-IA family hydrolase [Priestia megaterium]|uniref:HAD family hydrolase n=1 Tax=Priestia megaterium TaxID=1404 RepID=UPI0020769FE7|nr:HAD-IA family hydrolase [Priestia megaterium]USD17464.1 HAD-IA family hydrolase [Priestia megaterium]USD18555.1 HAD-IA family hydrolase [Priestia megaterium]
MIKAVIFDLDDTLISERKYIESGYKHIACLLSAQGIGTQDNVYNMLLNLFQESSINVFNRLFESLNISYTASDIRNLVNEYRNHFPTINFFDDVVPCLNELKRKGFKLGIITDGYASSQKAKLNSLSASTYFNEIIVTDELGREYWKPHQKPFEMIREKLQIEYEEMIYIGDNPEKDFYISNIYPIKTIRINRKGVYQNREYMDGIREHYSIKNLESFLILLDKDIIV